MEKSEISIWLFVFVLVLNVSFAENSKAQYKIGYPYVEHYDREDYDGHAQILTVTRNDQGFLYFANAFHGILKFDGSRWLRIQVPGGAGTRIVKHASDNRIYAGGIRSFGYIAYDEFGFPYFEPLHTRLPEEISSFNQIWRIFEYGDYIHFNSYEYLYRYHIPTGELDAIRFDHDFLHVLNIGDRIFTTKTGVNGIYAIENNEAIKLNNSDKIQSTVMHAGLVTALQDTLVLVRYQGFLRISDNDMSLFPTELDAYWEDVNAAHAAVLTDGNIAVATALNGIYIMSPDGKILEHYHSENILQTNNVYFIYTAQDGSFWAGTNLGIYRIDYGIPIRKAGRESNISSSINQITQLGDTIYMAKSVGLAYLVDKQVKIHPRKEDIGHQAFSLLALEDELIVGGNPNLASYTPSSGKIEIIDRGSAFAVIHLESEYKEILASFNTEIRVYRKVGDEWEKRASYDSGDSRIYSVLQTQNRDILLVGLDRSIHHLIQDKSKSYFEIQDSQIYTRDDLPDGAIFVHHIHNEDMLFFNFEPARTIQFDDHGELNISQKSGINAVFEGYNRMITLSDGRSLYQEFYPRVYSFVKVPGANRWLLNSNNFIIEAGYEDGKWFRASHSDAFYRKTQSRSERITDMFANEEYIFLSGPSPVLWKVKSEIPEFRVPQPEVHLNRIRAILDSTVTYAYHVRPESFPAGTRELHFEFATTPVNVPSALFYRFKLEGYEDWSEWTTDKHKEYNNLRHGSYRFHIQSVDLFQQKSEPFVYAFTIEPPIYFTTTAYIIYILFFIGFVGLILQIRSSFVERALRKEFEEEKRRLEEIRLNNELADARDFQLSLLPSSHPDWKDVEIIYEMETATEVGGDYYDFIEGHDGARYVVIGDASGHGTAAGMMVSITKTALNSIVAESPKDGLRQINEVLKSVNRSKLNMALSIIRIDDKSLTISSAGMPPVYHFSAREEKVSELTLIGLPLGAIFGAVYDQKEIEFHSGDFVLCVSDGLVETRNKKGETLGYDAVLEFLQNHPKESVSNVIQDLEEFRKKWAGESNELEDDLTFVLIHKKQPT